MKISNTIIELLLVSIIFCSCNNSIYKPLENYIGTNQPEQGYGKACPNPTYIATETAYASYSESNTNDYAKKIVSVSSNLWVANLLLLAKKNYGQNVTIQNIHWDTVDGKRVAATFDVVNCMEGIVPVRK